jgi:hypothetical protein
VRSKLNADGFIGQKYGKTCKFSDLFGFYKWMQAEFDRLGAKQMRLIPLTRVRRHHIRIDRKTLEQLLFPFVPKEDKDMVELEKAREGCDPRDELPPMPERDDPERAKKLREIKAIRDSPEFKERMEAYERRARNPAKDLPKVPPRPVRKNMKPEEYTAAKKEYEEAVKARDAAAAEASHVALSAAHKERVDLVDRILNSFFHPPSSVLNNRGAMKPTLCTDGVAVSLTFEKQVPREVLDPRKFLPRLPSRLTRKSCSDELWAEHQLRTKEAKALRAAEEATDRFKFELARYTAMHEGDEKRAEPTEAYDRALRETVCPHLKVAILGLDPGRTNIASIAMMYVSKEGKALKFKRSLSRASYYTRSGIWDDEKRRNKWHVDLIKKGWKQLHEGGATRTMDSDQVLGYIRACAEISKQWWETALKRREARQYFSAYVGKRRCLDGFYAEAKKAASKVVEENYGEGYDLHVAFGSEGPAMACTGKGEVAVPTTGSYKACKRAFKDTCLTWEWGSTCTSWGGERRDVVYKAPVEDGKGRVVMRLRHTAAKHPPVMGEADLALYKRYISNLPEEVQERTERNMQREKQPRFPQVRGLRFCPEIRNYLDRDAAAACTIGRLRLMEILKQGRPQPFCPKKESPASSQNRPDDGATSNPRTPSLPA